MGNLCYLPGPCALDLEFGNRATDERRMSDDRV